MEKRKIHHLPLNKKRKRKKERNRQTLNDFE